MASATLSQDPSDMLRRLKAAMASGRRHDVASAVEALIAVDAPIGDQWRMIAQLSRHDGRVGQARAAMERLARGRAGDPTVRFELAAFLADLGDVAAARRHFDALPPTFPEPATRAHFEGTLALNMGDLERAATLFARAVELRPTSGMSWLSLAEASRGRDPATWTDAVVAAATRIGGASPADRASFSYALGAAHEARREHALAFRAFSDGAAIMRAQRPYNRAADLAAVRQASDVSGVVAAPTIATDRAIFVFGPPRSGTTLVEQIIASHSSVAGGGELGLFDIVGRDIGGLTSTHLSAAASRVGIDALAGDYLSLIAERYGERGRVVDKTLTTTRLAGLVAAVLPDAPMIWVHRDPLDNGWSCFRTFFARGADWSWSLDDVGHHLALEAQMLELWRASLGERLLVVDYAALVSDPEPAIAEILRHCGLGEEAAPYVPHRKDRAVSTASVAQVRAPINRKGLGVAEPYRPYLEPLLDAYRSATRPSG